MTSEIPTGVEPARAAVPLRLLVVDDDEVDRMRIVRMLRLAPEWQAEIDVAVDIASGVAALRGRTYDCVLLDFRLPDGEGPDLLRQLRAIEGECPPVILQTVLDHEATAVAALAAGAQDYLVKGRFDSVLLRRAIRYAIERDRLVKERNRLTHELQEMLGRVKTLEGILPVCAWCRRIKDEDGVWDALEGYLDRHSKAKVSHGMCPDCARKYAP
ncbi:MAG: response regulator [Opitutaceae bacterium]|nr:response regulator [Opitutaceae bacterium]